MLKTTIESLRVLKYSPNGGFCAGVWRGAVPGLNRALVDADGAPRPALRAVEAALQPLLATVYPATSTLPARSTAHLAVHICNDLTTDQDVQIEATITDQRGVATRTWRGVVQADSVEFISDIGIRGGRIGDQMTVDLRVRDMPTGAVRSENSYAFTAT